MAASSNGAKIKIARPTINVGGKDEAALAEGLTSLLIVETSAGLYRCEAQFGNWGAKDQKVDFLYFDRQKIDFGKPLIVKLGTATIFEGRVMGLEGCFPEGKSPEIAVLAEDRFQDLRMVRRTRTFTDASDSDVFSQIANDHGLSPQVDVNGPTHKVLAQVNQSDLAFMRDRARAIDAELWIEGSTLHAKQRATRNGGTVEMTYGHELHEFTVLADLAGQRTGVTASGWDVSGKSALKYEATESAISSELSGMKSGASILSSALGERKENLAHTVPLTSQDAQNSAEAFFRMSARRFLTGHGVAEANADLRVGSYVDLKGLGPLFDGKYYLSEVRHIFGETGLTTEFTAERPGLGQP